PREVVAPSPGSTASLPGRTSRTGRPTGLRPPPGLPRTASRPPIRRRPWQPRVHPRARRSPADRNRAQRSPDRSRGAVRPWSGLPSIVDAAAVHPAVGGGTPPGRRPSRRARPSRGTRRRRAPAERSVGTRSQTFPEMLHQRHHGDPLLDHGVAVADGRRTIVERVEVDRDAEGGPDLVLAAVPTPDRSGVVVV